MEQSKIIDTLKTYQSHNPNRKERKIKEHNTGMTETREARVEQNTKQKAKPSTLYQI